MYRKIGIKLTTNYSYNFSIPKRSKNRIKFIIIHYTGMKTESNAIKRLQDPKSKVSSHYYVKKNGNVLNLVPDLYEAWHAGKSMWKNFKFVHICQLCESFVAINAVLSQNQIFVIYAILSQFIYFCVEKNLTKHCQRHNGPRN